MVSLKDIYWAAGFLEGEGSFYPDNTRPILASSQVQKQPLDQLQKSFGGTITLIVRKQPSNHKDIFLWKLRGPKAIGLMMTIYCIMSLRRQTQIKKVLSSWRQTTRFNKKPQHPTPQLMLQF